LGKKTQRKKSIIQILIPKKTLDYLNLYSIKKLSEDQITIKTSTFLNLITPKLLIYIIDMYDADHIYAI